MKVFSQPKADALGATVFAGLGLIIAYRITLGIDLSDESYYASFIYAWLKEGLHGSQLRTLHETAALIVFPFVAFRFTHTTGGLILSLRELYLSGSIVAALCLTYQMRRALGPIGWIAGSCVLSFIPFGLPAPSYNTLPLQFFVIGGALLAVRLSYPSPAWLTNALLLTSAFAMSLGCVAYPPLVIVFAFLVCIMFRVLPTALAKRYVAFAVGTLTICVLTVAFVLGLQELSESMIFHASMSDTFNAVRKAKLLLLVFFENPEFTAIALLAMCVGIWRERLKDYILPVTQTAIIVASLMIPSVLFIHSHDVIFFVALTGLALVTDIKATPPWKRALSALYSASLLYALIATLTTASNGLFNFAVGGLLAAIIAVCYPVGDVRGWQALRMVALACFCAALLWQSFYFRYGEYGYSSDTTSARVMVSAGPFSGLLATASQARIVQTASEALSQFGGVSPTLAVVGRVPGIYLLGGALPRTLMAYPIVPVAQPRAVGLLSRYYEDAKHRPYIVIDYADPYFASSNPFGENFGRRYRLRATYATPPGVLKIYTKQSDL